MKKQSQFQRGDIVNVLFPGNGILKDCEVIEVYFPPEATARYDVEVPFEYIPHFNLNETETVAGKAQINSIKEWHLRSPEHAISDRYDDRLLPDTADER